MSQPSIVIPLDLGRDKVEVSLLMKEGGEVVDSQSFFVNDYRDLEDIARWWKSWEDSQPFTDDGSKEHTCALEFYLP